ncbi:hypothetical protein [Streptomyces sp. NPDC002054]|uniref:hypothetical protein n=1 Tax=Streptomyces sp. NPDC002054 TaxID=3154663 RepID=UPI003328B44B
MKKRPKVLGWIRGARGSRCDTTPAKQGRLTPSSHIPVRPAESFAAPYPDYALLSAWNYVEES